MKIQTAVADLLQTGLTQPQLAELVPCSQSTISSLLTGARGKRTSFGIGSRLLELHRERCAGTAPTEATEAA